LQGYEGELIIRENYSYKSSILFINEYVNAVNPAVCEAVCLYVDLR